MEGKYDGVFYTIVQSSEGKGFDALFDEVFSWLRRKTDYFSDKVKAEKCIATMGEKQAKLWAADQDKKTGDDAARQIREADRKRQVDEADKKKKQAEEATKAKIDEPKVEEPKKEETEAKKDGEEEEDKTPAPKGNGGKTDKYTWTQTLTEAKVMFEFPGNLRGKDFNVTITSTHCTVGLKNQPAIVDKAEWPEMINGEDTNWILEPTPEGGKLLSINILKWSDRNGWWDCAYKGHEKIDTKKIQPETSKVSDLDGEMKGQVEKMMFDMKQKQLKTEQQTAWNGMT